MPAAARPVPHYDKWRIRWLDHEGKRQSAVFDDFDEAKRQLRKHQTEVDEIRDGTRLAIVPNKTFGELADYWLKHKAPQKRSKADDESIIRDLREAFGALPVRAVATEAVDQYVAARTHLAVQTIRNRLTLLGTMLRLAVKLGWLPAVPAFDKPKANPDDDVDPPWLKTQDEIRRFLDAAQAEPDPLVFVLYRTAVYTGLRAGELAGLRWADVDLKRRTIHVRRSYGGRTKTRSSRRYVPIVDVLLPTLAAWQLQRSGELVFPNARGRMFDESARIFQEILHEVLDRAGFARPSSGRSKHYIHFHSLRHTFACHWRLSGGPLEDSIRLLGHTSKAMTEHYANIGGYYRPEHLRIFA